MRKFGVDTFESYEAKQLYCSSRILKLAHDTHNAPSFEVAESTRVTLCKSEKFCNLELIWKYYKVVLERYEY